MSIPHSRKHIDPARILALCLLAACVVLLVCTEKALDSAAFSLTLFFSRVLPALFPFYVLTSMLFRLGACNRLISLCKSAFLPSFLLGLAAGNPTGARMSVLLLHEEYAAPTNLCSPMFLLGVVSIGLCGNAAFFWPLAIAQYGSALLLLPLCHRQRATSLDPLPISTADGGPLSGLFADIGDGVRAMLNIGGCIVFFYVLSDTALSLLFGERMPVLSAVLIGLIEMTAGATRIAALALPAPVTAGMLAFLTTFGGICVFAQVMIVAPLQRPGAYILYKGMQGCLAGILAYLLTPLFLNVDAPVWSSNAELYAENALIGFTFLLAACVGLLATYVLSLLAKRTRAS